MNKTLKTVLITIIVLVTISFIWQAEKNDISNSNSQNYNQDTKIIDDTQKIQEPTPQVSDTNNNELIQRKILWIYNNQEWSMTLNLNSSIDKMYKERSRNRDYDLFASDFYSDTLVSELASALKNLTLDYELNSDQLPYFVTSFVQSLPYTSDKVSTGFDEYPKFPYETLYDNGGDCEDTAILTIALLQKLEYGAVLIKFPSTQTGQGHMAVGVKCSQDIYGSSIQYLGQRYCYLETTAKGWEIGSMPEEFKGKLATIIPVYKKPSLNIEFTYKYSYGLSGTNVDIDVIVRNLGSEKANNVKVYVALQTTDITKAWDSIESENLEIEPEGAYVYNVTNLHAPYKADFRVYARAFGDNVVSGEYIGEWLKWS
ncbi:hypothetical protein FJZ19_00060 [Candidatus Pacearchaeota archaeon]|nr:hypothetical protein [Candidatus Pacearchaeota archaeon]